MNGKKLLAKFVKALFTWPESQIILGRSNVEVDDFSGNFVVIDSMLSMPQSTTRDFDDEAEEMTYTVHLLDQMSLNFYGEKALENALKFTSLCSSQTAREIMAVLGISLYHPTAINNLSFLAGSEQENRFEITVKMRYTYSYTEPTLKIETINFDEFLTD